MVDSSLVGWGATKDLRLPSIQVRVEVDYRDRTVSTIDRTKQREHYSMVAAECDDTRMVFAIEGDSLQRLASSRVITKRRESLTMKKLLVAIFDLLNGILIVIRRNGDIATVDQL